MSADFDSLSSQAMSLPPELRVELAQLLWKSVDRWVDDDEDLAREIERRCAELDSGAVEAIPFDIAMQEIRDHLNESRDSSTGAT